MTEAIFQHYTAEQARGMRAAVEDVYCRSYVDAIASGDPFDSPAQFMRRFDAYTDPARDRNFELVVASVGGVSAGQSWGWPLQAGAVWWDALVLEDGDHAEFVAETGARTFALSEIMVCAEHVGQGLARALHDELLRKRTEQRATLLVNPDNERAYARYRKWGWYRVGRQRPGWENAPSFDVLMHDLPL